MSLDRRTEPVPPDLDVVMGKCYQDRSLKFVMEHGLEHREERVTAQMEERHTSKNWTSPGYADLIGAESCSWAVRGPGICGREKGNH